MDLEEAIEKIESEIGEWGSISMRLGDEYTDAMKVIIAAARQTMPERPTA